MPRSKRNKTVPISKVKKNENISGKKAVLAEKVKSYLEEYEYCYVIKYKNMTNLPMQELRNYWKNSKFVIGKNKVLHVALGKTEDDEFKLNSHKLSKFLKGNCGLVFSNDEPDYVVEYLFNFFKF
jgi:mRNA turnover protein 4